MTSSWRTGFAGQLGISFLVVIGAVLPFILSGYWLSVITLVLVFSIFAASINLLAGYAGMVTLGQGGTLAVAGYAVAYISTHTDRGYVAQIAIAMAAVIVVSAIFGLMAVRATLVYFLMVTLAQGMVIWGLAYSLSSITGGENGIPDVNRPAGLSGAYAFYYVCFGIAVVTMAAISVFVRSPFGLGMRAIQSNEGRARAVGYNTTLHRFLAFMASGCIAGVAGILLVYLNEFISPSIAYFQMSADGMVMALIGGLGTTLGPLVGALFLVVMKNVVSGHISRWPTVEGIFFIVIVLYARHGLVGLVNDGWRKIRGRMSTNGARSRSDQQQETDVRAVDGDDSSRVSTDDLLGKPEKSMRNEES